MSPMLNVRHPPRSILIPKQLAAKGALQLKRREALKLTGRLFKLRRDVNLVSNVLDVPELFWDEASLKKLYDAVREYMEIGPRVQVLNDKLVMASDFLDAIHDHLNNSAMERITWIIIWLIVVACLVELGEVIARLVVHATTKPEIDVAPVITQLSRAEVLRILDGMSDA
ncbi:Sad1-interacting factor 3 [Marasmius tenuissimus]|uniref:Sad1-interacting factor 3 n=1 Tax=Marasmius tenuissimus TaxID=585030 RepID=A0ABR3A2V4_9AGAR